MGTSKSVSVTANGSTACSLYYVDIAPGFTPVYALCLGGDDAEMIWRNGATSFNAALYYGGYYTNTAAQMPFTSTQCRLVGETSGGTYWYWIFGY